MKLKKLNFKEWNAVLKKFTLITPDIYYFPEYYATWQKLEQAEAVCLYSNIEGIDFIYPFFIRPINGYDLKKKYFDIYSAYGYGGLISSISDPIDSAVQKINELIDKWCLDNNVVSEFIRENRIAEFKGKYIRNAEHIKIRTNVYTNLKNDLNKELSRSRKRYLNIARRSGLTYTIDNKGYYIKDFATLYYKTMKKVNASNFYFFNIDYFNLVFKLLNKKAEFIFVWQDSKPVASALCFHSGHNYIYHLGASDPDKLFSKPNDFLFYTMMKRAQELNFRYVSFGGGTTNKPEDTLFQFKSKFGSLTYPCHIGKKIHMNSIYQKLCLEWKNRYPKLFEKFNNFVQKYQYIK